MPMKFSTTIKSILKEVVLITTGVVLALMLSQWNETRKEKEQARFSLVNIKSELERNKKAVSKALQYHQDLYDKIINEPDSAIMSLNFAQLSNNAWELSKNTRLLNYLDYQVSLKLVEIYDMQEEYDQDTKIAYNMMSTSSILGTNQLKTINEWKQGWIGSFQSTLYVEKLLVEKYEKALAAIEGVRL